MRKFVGGFILGLAVMAGVGCRAQTVTLSGVGTPPAASLDLVPANLVFPTTLAGISVNQVVTVSAAGAAGANPISISSVSSSGVGFSEVSNCPATLAAGQSCQVTVTFAPTTSGTASGALTITDSASGSPQTIALAGTGAFLGISPTTLAFGSVVEGKSSAAQTVTLTNPTAAAVTFSALITPTDYAVTSGCGTTLPASGTCTLSVVFTPTIAGSEPGVLTISATQSGDSGTEVLTFALGSRPDLGLQFRSKQ